MSRSSETYGFNGPPPHPARTGMLPRLVATLALAVGTIIAATAVSIGIARAEVLDTISDHGSGALALALLIGALFVASCLSVALAPRRNSRGRSSSDHAAIRRPPRF
jgi:hypothetical protein